MTRWQGTRQADRVAPDRAADRPGRARPSDGPGQPAVARHLAPRDPADPAEDPPIPARSGPRARSGRRRTRPAGPRGVPRRRRSRDRADAGSPVPAAAGAAPLEPARDRPDECVLRSSALERRPGRARRPPGGSGPRAPRPRPSRSTTGLLPGRTRARPASRQPTAAASARRSGRSARWYTPREYDDEPIRAPLHHRASRVGTVRRSSSPCPADRRHDLRLVRQPDRALPRQDAGRRGGDVNLATEVATIRYLPDVAGRTELVGAIEAAGYELEAARRRAPDRRHRAGRSARGRAGRRGRRPGPRAARSARSRRSSRSASPSGSWS